MEFKNLKNTFKKNYQLFVFIIKKKFLYYHGKNTCLALQSMSKKLKYEGEL